MSYSRACLCVFLLYFVINNYQCMKTIPERAELVYFNKLYFEDTPILNVRRYNRRGEYCLNVIFTNKIVLGNTVTVHLIFYQYLHNEFRRSFPELHFNLCDLINNDPFIGKSIRTAGMTSCPIQPGKHDVSNMTFNHKIPSVWPFEKGMGEVIIKNTNDQLIAKGSIVATFKQDLPKPKI